MTEITSGARNAAIGLLLLTLIVGGANLWATFLVVHANQAAERRQGQIVERKLCTTLGRLIVLQPPPGNPDTNPSRAYLQELHTTLSQLGPDVGCPS